MHPEAQKLFFEFSYLIGLTLIMEWWQGSFCQILAFASGIGHGF